MNISCAANAAAWAAVVGVDAFQPPAASTVRRQVQTGQSWGQLHVASLTPPPSTDEPTVAETKPAPDSPDFNWFKSWHPIVPVEILYEEKPHAFTLLGMDIVIWNDGPIDSDPAFQARKERTKGAKKVEGTRRAFVDQCPHRKVPLSEGRIEDDGSLFCSYHGWRFSGEGETIDIPQIEQNELEKIKANPKSNCNSFPVQVKDGMLWVWPDSSEDAKIESALSAVPTNNYEGEDVDEERIWVGTWNYRELPYGHDYFIENVVDPAHVPVSHHNVVGSSYGDQSLKVDTLQSLTKDGFSIGTSNGEVTNGSTTFNAPSQVLIKAPFGKKGARQYLELYSSPSRPSFCNHVGRMVIIKDSTLEMPKLLKAFTALLPKWANHFVASTFLHQDALFLHGQERSLTHNGEYRTAQPANDSYAKAVMPCSTDKGVMNFRTWMSEFAGGFIPFKGDTRMPAADNEVVFDVWNGHTKHCKYCLTALRRIKKIRSLTFLMAALVVATIRPKMLGVVGSTVSALGLTGVGFLLSKLVKMFYRYDFSHADNH